MNTIPTAEYLADKFSRVGLQQRNEGIACTLICVDEMISSIDVGFEDFKSLSKINYWQEVKLEIQKL